MSSTLQIEANRRNGQLSEGPKSSEGKATSSRNSLKHGFTAKEVLLPNEDPEAFAELSEGLRADYNPQGVMESVLVERIIGLYWRLRRLGKVEADIFNSQQYGARVAGAKWKLNEVRSDPRSVNERKEFIVALSRDPKLRDLLEEQEIVKARLYDEMQKASLKGTLKMPKVTPEEELPPGTYGEAFLVDSNNQNALAKLSRYETSMERSLYKALHELERLQAARQGKDVPVPLVLDVDVSGVEPR